MNDFLFKYVPLRFLDALLISKKAASYVESSIRIKQFKK